jgi:hypothetical protein
MPLSVPLPLDTPVSTFRVTLDGSDYVVTLDYHAREDRYFFSLATTDGEVLIAGVKLVPRWSTLRGVVNPARPHGLLVVLATVNDDGPGFYSLGRSFSLLYYTAEERAAL